VIAAVPTLEELAREPGRAAALPPALRSALVLRCAVVLAALASPAPTDGFSESESRGEDRLLDVKEAAQRLGTSTDYLYRHGRTLPFTVRVGSRLRFSSRGIDRYIRVRQGR
jgi:predicted DNA-binding transcriptional regulator AlpA